MAAGEVLQHLQGLLAGIYDLPVGYDVRDFLLTEPEHLPASVRASGTDEQVLVREQDQCAEVGVYLDAQLLERLAAADPVRALNAGNLADCCTALEGVSHFMCLAWNAGHDRGVSVLELELQAEIDKYVASLWLLRSQDPSRFPAELHRLLFEQSRVDPRLAGERAGLYREASRYAALYCRRLERRLQRPATRELASTLAELRRFYRLSHESKRAHIRYQARRH